MASLYGIALVFLIGVCNAKEIQADKTIHEETVIVPIEEQEKANERPNSVYSLFEMPSFDGEQIRKDISEKMGNVVEQFSSKIPKNLPSLSLKSDDKSPSTWDNLFNSVPDWNTEPVENAFKVVASYFQPVFEQLGKLGEFLNLFLENTQQNIPDINELLREARDTLNNIDLTPVREAAGDIVAVLPTVAVLCFYGLTLYFVFSLLFRAAGFAIATKLKTLRLASDVFMQAPEFVSRMMMGDTAPIEAKMADIARSDTQKAIGVLDLLRGAQKVSEAFDKYNEMNQE